MSEAQALSAEQVDILRHTAYRAAGGRFCGGGPDMDVLVKLGLMRELGRVSWVPDAYYGITSAGRQVLEAKNELDG